MLPLQPMKLADAQLSEAKIRAPVMTKGFRHLQERVHGKSIGQIKMKPLLIRHFTSCFYLRTLLYRKIWWPGCCHLACHDGVPGEKAGGWREGKLRRVWRGSLWACLGWGIHSFLHRQLNSDLLERTPARAKSSDSRCPSALDLPSGEGLLLDPSHPPDTHPVPTRTRLPHLQVSKWDLCICIY